MVIIREVVLLLQQQLQFAVFVPHLSQIWSKTVLSGLLDSESSIFMHHIWAFLTLWWASELVFQEYKHVRLSVILSETGCYRLSAGEKKYSVSSLKITCLIWTTVQKPIELKFSDQKYCSSRWKKCQKIVKNSHRNSKYVEFTLTQVKEKVRYRCHNISFESNYPIKLKNRSSLFTSLVLFIVESLKGVICWTLETLILVNINSIILQ